MNITSDPQTVNSSLPVSHPGSSPDAQYDVTAGDERLREALKRCSPATLEAARQLRQRGDLDYLPTFVHGVIVRFVEPDLKHRVTVGDPDLRLIEDLGLDSLTLMEVILLAEDVLPVTITNEELRHLRTVGEVQSFLAGKLRPSPVAAEGEPETGSDPGRVDAAPALQAAAD